MDEGDRAADALAAVKMEDPTTDNRAVPKKERPSASTSPNESKPPSRSSSLSPGGIKAENESASTPDTEPAPKLSRKASSKPRPRTPPRFDHLPDATDESTKAFQIIHDCLYGSKHMGSSDHDALDCDCAEEWRKLAIPPHPLLLVWTPLKPAVQETARTTRVARTRTA